MSVTDREGNTNEINLNADETVNLTITSLVEGINVAGIKVNVYLNNGKRLQHILQIPTVMSLSM